MSASGVLERGFEVSAYGRAGELLARAAWRAHPVRRGELWVVQREDLTLAGELVRAPGATSVEPVERIEAGKGGKLRHVTSLAARPRAETPRIVA